MTEPRIITIGECEIRIFSNWMETVFKDGLSVPAAANDDPDSVARAHDLGYEGDTWRMSMAHEIAHSLICRAQGQDYSYVLRGVAIREAGGDKQAIISHAESDAEESLVLDFQRYAQLGILTPRLVQSGLDLDALAAELREKTA